MSDADVITLIFNDLQYTLVHPNDIVIETANLDMSVVQRECDTMNAYLAQNGSSQTWTPTDVFRQMILMGIIELRKNQEMKQDIDRMRAEVAELLEIEARNA